jgi:2-phospho-L-lactate guanylyltransferase
MSKGNRLWAVVPVKRFSAAKSRLASVLGSAERAELAQLMFEDVLDALTASQDLFAGILVATSDGRAAILAKGRGMDVVLDTADRGINAAVSQAVRIVRAGTDDGLMVVPSDIPLVTSNAFRQAVAALATKPSLAIAAAADDRGTNLLACRPVDAISPCFGSLSFDRHLIAATRAGVGVQILCMPELSLDIDRPENLRTLLTVQSCTRTRAFLSRISIVERLDKYRSPARPAFDREAAGLWS